MNVSPRLVTSARKILKTADPLIIKSVELGKRSISNAAAWAAEPKTQQRGEHLFNWWAHQTVDHIAMNPCSFLESAAKSALENNSEFDPSLNEFLSSIRPPHLCLLEHLIGDTGDKLIKDAATRYLRQLVEQPRARSSGRRTPDATR